MTDSNSGFVVVWTSIGQDGDVAGIFAKKLSYTGLQLTQEPLPQTVHEGDNATFLVNASSHHGNVQYEWYKNSILVDNDSSLTLTDITMADNDAQIFCRVFDELKSIASPDSNS